MDPVQLHFDNSYLQEFVLHLRHWINCVFQLDWISIPEAVLYNYLLLMYFGFPSGILSIYSALERIKICNETFILPHTNTHNSYKFDMFSICLLRIILHLHKCIELLLDSQLSQLQSGRYSNRKKNSVSSIIFHRNDNLFHIVSIKMFTSTSCVIWIHFFRQ